MLRHIEGNVGPNDVAVEQFLCCGFRSYYPVPKEGEYFDGSASSFVLSLLGSKRITPSELKRHRSLLEQLPTSLVKRNSKG